LERETLYRNALERFSGDSAPSVAEVARSIGLSPRQVFRLKAQCRILGPEAVDHGNRGRPSPHAAPDWIHQQVLQIFQDEFADLDITYTQFSEIARDEYAIPVSAETIRRWLIDAGLGHKPHRTRRHRRFRLRSARRGDMLFLDGSPHRWFGPEHPRSTLILASDDATGAPLYGLFEAQESLNGCFQALYHVASRWGLPGCLYLDRAGQFTTTRHGGIHRPQSAAQPTAFEIAMRRLGIELIFANSPQARGRGERLNRSFQNRLVVELRRAGIATYQAATDYVNEQFIPRYTERFAVEPRNPASGFRPVPAGTDLRRTLCRETTRNVNSDNTIVLHRYRYQLKPPTGVRSLCYCRLTVQEWFDGSVHIFHPHFGEIPNEVIPCSEVASLAANARRRGL
jgi:hypothetical protein